MYAKTLVVLVSLLLAAVMYSSCKKGDNPGDASVVRILNDTADIIDSGSPYSYYQYQEVDIDNDGIMDIQVMDRLSTSKDGSFNDSFIVFPLHSGMQVAKTDSMIYLSRDSVVCSGSYYTYITKTCAADDPKLFSSVHQAYAYIRDTNAIPDYIDFDKRLVLSAWMSRRKTSACVDGLEVIIGNMTTAENFLVFQTGSSQYRVKLIKEPLGTVGGGGPLIIYSVTTLK